MPSRSYRVIAEGGRDLWDDMKAKSLKVVKVLTTDAEFPVAHLIRNNKQEIRIAIYGPTRPGDGTFDTRRPRAQVLAIPQGRIRQLVELGGGNGTLLHRPGIKHDCPG